MEVRQVPVADLPQQLHGGDDALAVLPGDARPLVRVGADGDVQTVVLFLQLLERDIIPHLHLGVDLDPQGEDGCDLRVQQLPGEAVAGDAVAEHPAQLLPLLIDGDLVAHQGQVVGGGKAAGAAADDGDRLSGGFRLGRIWHLPGVVHGEPLQAPDVDGVVHHLPAATGLAGVLADVGAGCGEGIVLPNEADCVGIAPLPHQGDIAGDIHPGGAQGHTGDGILQTAQAAVAEDVFLIVVPDAVEARQHQLGGVDADGAVRGGHDYLRRVLDQLEDVQGRPSVQDLVEQVRQLSQAHPAGHAFPAGLGMAEVQKVQRHINRAQARRAGLDPVLHAAVQMFHHHLGLAGGFNIQSAHARSLLLIKSAKFSIATAKSISSATLNHRAQTRPFHRHPHPGACRPSRSGCHLSA